MTETGSGADKWESMGLDPEWLTGALSSSHRAPSAIEFVEFVGTGQMSRNARFAVKWSSDSDEGSEPTSIVVKVPSSEPNTRKFGFERGTYLKECDFYRCVQPLVDVSSPAPFGVHYDQDAQDFVIVLEDLAGSRQGDQFTEPTDEQLMLAVEQAAALQAPVWGDISRPAFATYQEETSVRTRLIAEALPQVLPMVHQRLGADLEPEVIELLDQFTQHYTEWATLRGGPTTLVHGDFRPDNFMFAVEPDAPPVTIVDWQTLGLGSGATDLAYLLGGALSPERRLTVEAAMLAAYSDELAGRGVEYSAEECRTDYELGVLHGVVVAIMATALADHTERGDALFALMLNRHGRHALELEVMDRVLAC